MSLHFIWWVAERNCLDAFVSAPFENGTSPDLVVINLFPMFIYAVFLDGWLSKQR
jgi:hypothetical protein